MATDTSNWTVGDWDNYMAKVSIMEGTSTNMKSALKRVGASQNQINDASSEPVEGVIFNHHYIKDWKTNSEVHKVFRYCPNGGNCLWKAMETTQDLLSVWKEFFPNKPVPSGVRYWNSIIRNQRNTNGLLTSFGVTVPQAQKTYKPSDLPKCSLDSFKR